MKIKAKSDDERDVRQITSCIDSKRTQQQRHTIGHSQKSNRRRQRGNEKKTNHRTIVFVCSSVRSHFRFTRNENETKRKLKEKSNLFDDFVVVFVHSFRFQFSSCAFVGLTVVHFGIVFSLLGRENLWIFVCLLVYLNSNEYKKKRVKDTTRRTRKNSIPKKEKKTTKLKE